MTYIPVKEASKIVGVHTKTIKRAVRDGQIKSKRDGKGKTAPILVELEQVKERWGQTGQDVQADVHEATQEVHTSDDNVREVLRALQSTIKTLEKQLGEKDKQLERLDKKLDQQQQLSAGIQKQLLMLQAPMDGQIVQEDTKRDDPDTTKKPKPKQKKASTKRDKKGRYKKKGFFDRLFN